MTLTTDDVAMFYGIFTGAERVDWARYEEFRLAILASAPPRLCPDCRAVLPPETPSRNPLMGWHYCRTCGLVWSDQTTA